MEKYPAYKKYKLTRCAWLQEIPEHWKFKRLKNLSTHNDDALDELTDPDLVIEYVDISSVSLINGVEKTEFMPFVKAPSRARRHVKHGDIIVSTVRTYLKAIAPISEPPENMVVSTGFAVVRPKVNFSSGFAGYLLQSNGFVGEVVANSVGVSYPAINASDLVRIAAVEPPLEEQKAIARFLDFKTNQIDALIAKKKALLEKLAEKRTALISHAVTKGLNSTVAMKDSGVEWLGKIPAHWIALPLRRLIQTVKTGTTPVGVNEFHFSESGVSWFRPGDFSDQIFIESAEKKLSDEGVSEVRVFPAFTVMHVGIGATIGKVGITTEPSSCNQQINAIVCNERLHHLFAAYFLQAIKQYIVKCGKYTTLPIINQDETKALFFTVPPVGEQVEISEHLLREELLMEQQAKMISLVIARLQEYRSALITSAVSGKIDVRDFAILQIAEGIAS